MIVSIMRVSVLLQDDPDIIERLAGGFSGGIRQAVEGVKQVVEMGKQAISSLSHEKKQAPEGRALSHRNCTLDDSIENIASRKEADGHTLKALARQHLKIVSLLHCPTLC